MLATFRRRIPAEITLPDYNNRRHLKKFNYYLNFLKMKQLQLIQKIFCSIELLQNLYQGQTRQRFWIDPEISIDLKNVS